jgi:O-succinylhomoserine sulfhydrylase
LARGFQFRRTRREGRKTLSANNYDRLAGTANWREATRLVRGGTMRSNFAEVSEALFLTSGYAYDSAEQAEARFKGEDEGFIYSRFGNPTVAMFEERMALLEGAETARAFATGMAAVTAAMLCHLNKGDHVVAARALFGSCRHIVEQFLPRFGIESTLVDGREPENFRKALRPETKVIFLETPSNPGLEIIDLAAVAAIAREAGVRLIVDNVFATPVLQKPMDFGADIVIYSATKHIDGQGRCLGGVVLCDRAFADDYLQMYLRHTGPAISPFNAWVMLKGLETLELRMERHCRAAAEIAGFLSTQNKVARVLYPGREDHPQHALALRQMKSGGGLVTFFLDGGKREAFRFCNALRLIDISNNLGDAKSLITHPATTTHQKVPPEEREILGITDAMLRLSVGLEDVADIRDDIACALDAV